MGKAEDYLREQEVKEREEQLKAILDAVIPPLIKALESKQGPGTELVQFGFCSCNRIRFWRKKRECTHDEVTCWSIGFDISGNEWLLLSTGELGIQDLSRAWRWDLGMYTEHNLMMVLLELADIEEDHLQTDFIKQAVVARNSELDDKLYEELADELELNAEEGVA